MTVDPKNLNEPEKIRNLLANAQRAGRADLVLQCQLRLAELAGSKFESALEQDFWTAIGAAEEFATLKNGKTTRLSRTRQKVSRDGITKTLADLALKPKPSDGFILLVEGGRVDLTAEAIVLKHAELFSDEVRAAAQTKLNAIANVSAGN